MLAMALAAVVSSQSTPSSANAGAPPTGDRAFAAHGSGATASVQLLRAGETQAVNVQVALAGQSVNSLGLGAPIVSELNFSVQPRLPETNAYGRGSGLEVGAGTPVPGIPDPNQVLVGGVAEAMAPPSSQLVAKQTGPVGLNGSASATFLRARAQATYHASGCVTGRPLSFAEAEAGGVQLGIPSVGTQLPLLGLTLTSGDPDLNRNVSQTRSVSYLTPNGDGTFGIASETRQTIAPVTLLGGLLTIELLGEWVLRAIATGKPGGARVEYAPLGAEPTTPVLLVNGSPITFQQLLRPEGLVIDLAPLAVLRVGAPARDIFGAGPARTDPTGTAATGAVDVLQLTLLDLTALGLGVAEIRLGHMEAVAVVPTGGVTCGPEGNAPPSQPASPQPARPPVQASGGPQLPATGRESDIPLLGAVLLAAGFGLGRRLRISGRTTTPR